MKEKVIVDRNMQIAKRIQGIAASQSLAMAARAKAMKAAGIDVISMSLGEPDMDTPEHVRRAAQEAIDNHWSHYGPVAGVESLREAIAERANEESLKYINQEKHACGTINIDKEEKKNAESSVAYSNLHSLDPQSAREQAPGQPTAQSCDADTAELSLHDSLQKCAIASENTENRIEWKAEDVVVSVGAKMAIYNAIQTIVNSGDEVIIPMPSWVSYTEMVKLAEGTVVPIQTKYEDRYCMTAEELRGALTGKTRMLILCSPNNPTGSVYSYEELQAIVEVLREYPQVAVLSDEIYNALVYEEYINIDKSSCAAINKDKEEIKNAHSTSAMPDGPRGLERNHPQALTSELAAPVDANTPNLLPDVQHVECLQKYDVPSIENIKNIVCSMAEFDELAERLIIVNGVSKAYAMTGWRVGWLLSKNKAFIEACTRLQGQQLTCATMVAQKAAEAALRGDQECVAEMRQVFAERRELICRLAAEIPGWKFEKPHGAFYLFPDVSALGGGDKVAEYLLEEAYVAVVSGTAFGCPECIRLSYAISTEEIIEAMRRIKVAITKIVNKQK